MECDASDYTKKKLDSNQASFYLSFYILLERNNDAAIIRIHC